MRQYAVVVGVVLTVIGGTGYIRDTVRGTTQPNRATFFLWALAPSIAFAAEVREGVGWSSVATLVAGLEPGLILLASFLHAGGQWRLRRFDYTCAALSVLALVLWRATGSRNVAITLSVLSDFLAAVPTIVKSYRHPESETGWTYVAGSLNGLAGLVAIQSLSFAMVAFPFYLFLCMGVIAVETMVPRSHYRIGVSA